MENSTGEVKMKLGLKGDPIIRADYGYIGFRWQYLDSFFKAHSIVPNWNWDCSESAGVYDAELEKWTGCIGKVKICLYKYIRYFVLAFYVIYMLD